jgi:hypothetical protein
MNDALAKMLNEIQQIRNTYSTGGVGNVSNQEMQMFNEMLNNAPTGGSSVGNMSDIEYMRANNPVVSAFGNVSDREMQMFKANPLEYMRENNPTNYYDLKYSPTNAEVARFQQLQRGIGNVSDRENITLQEMIDVIGRQRNPYVFN